MDSSESRELPLWWRREFLNAQDPPIHSFTRGPIIIPFFQAGGRVEVGLIGPYSAAFSCDFIHTTAEISAAWEEFSASSKLPIVVRLPPESHFPEVLRHNVVALERLGAEAFPEETNHTIHLDQEILFRRNRQRHLRAAENLGLRVAEAGIPETFAVLRANRSAKNYAMSLSQAQLGRLHSRIPGSIECLTVIDQGRHIAASVTFLVSSDIDYVFMWGGDPNANHNSEALTLLAYEIIRKSRARERKRLCLGTSSFSGVVNEGLAIFKESLGARREPKTSFIIPPRFGKRMSVLPIQPKPRRG